MCFHFSVYWSFWWSKCLSLTSSTFQGGVRCLQFDDKKIVSGSWDMTVMVGSFSLYPSLSLRIDFPFTFPPLHHFPIDVQLPWTSNPMQQNPVIPPNRIAWCPVTPLSHAWFYFIIYWLSLSESVLFTLFGHFLCGYTQMYLTIITMVIYLISSYFAF